MMDLPKNISDEIWDYCRLNNITDINGFIVNMVKQGFTIEKFGATPAERVVEKIVEKIVEKPIEVIKEVEKIVETKVYLKDDEATTELSIMVDNLGKELKSSETKYNEQLAKEKILNTKIVNLEVKIEELNSELSKEKTKKSTGNDIYGEG
jgi:phage antirepressor YoqD-like protein